MFARMTWIWWTKTFGTNDISLGIHICWAGRIDIHFWTGMLSIGRVPLYVMPEGTRTAGSLTAVSNSYHESVQDLARRNADFAEQRRNRVEARAGNPLHP